jgi:hypothetical protein
MLNKPTRAVSGKEDTDTDADVYFHRHGAGVALSSEEQFLPFLYVSDVIFVWII